MRLENQLSFENSNINTDSTPIEKILEESGLISEEEVKQAFNVQKELANKRLGEIFAIQKGIRLKTIDFFENKWNYLKQKGYQFPLGYYLQEAFLLDDQQIQIILKKQKENQLKFGEIAVSKGWIKQKTINFFLDKLSKNSTQLISLKVLEQYNTDRLHLEHKYKNCSLILARILAWTAGEPILSCCLCQAFADGDYTIPVGQEHHAVDQLVENLLIKNWSTSDLGRKIRFTENFIDSNENSSPLNLWQEYKDILLRQKVKYKSTTEQKKLLNVGLVVLLENNNLQVTNLIFSYIFNQAFVNDKIDKSFVKIKTDDNSVKAKNNIKLQESDSENNHFVKNEKIDDNPQKNKSSTSKLVLLLVVVHAVLIAAVFWFSMNKNKSIKEQGLEEVCQSIALSDVDSRLDSIFQLEQKKKYLDSQKLDDSGDFPQNCEDKLNKLRMLAIPELGKDNNILEAVGYLCKVPKNSELITEAEIWIDRWQTASSWDKEVKKYLESTPECPAAGKFF